MRGVHSLRTWNFWINLPSSTTNLGKGKHDTPYFTLISQAVLADDLQLRVTMNSELIWNTRHE